MLLAVGRLAAVAAFAPAAAAQATIEERTDVAYGGTPAEPLLLDVYAPHADGGERRPSIVMIHGGSFREGDKSSFAPEARKFAERGYVVFSVNYRLDQPSAFPAELDDVQAAVRWVRVHAREYQLNPARIGALGESAGGTLAALLATVGDGPLDRDARVAAAVSWSGPMDLVALASAPGLSGSSPGTSLMGCTVDTCRSRFEDASPITHVDRTDAPLKLVSSADELVPVSQAVAMDDRLLKAGVHENLEVFRGTRHALEYRDEAIGTTVSWFETYLQDNGKSPAGTVAFAGTVVVVIAGGVVLVLLWRRRQARVLATR